MLKRSFSGLLLLIVAASLCGATVVSAQARVDLETAKVRAKVEALGVNTQVEVKLIDKTKLRGRIGGTDRDSFYLDNLAGGNTKILYSEVSDVKKHGSGWSTRQWVILGSVAAGALVTWTIVKPALCDGGAQTRGPC
ncbi:MAG TPA: hypothetical protein VIT88_06030 [Pyrinomonadaceae bacterium]